MNFKGVIVRSSEYSVVDTMNRLVIFLQNHGATIYARINQQTEAHSVGFEILPLEFVLFGNPKSGAKIMNENPIAALDLPLKIIVWQDQDGVWIAHNDAFYIEDRYGLSHEIDSPLSLSLLITNALKK